MLGFVMSLRCRLPVHKASCTSTIGVALSVAILLVAAVAAACAPATGPGQRAPDFSLSAAGGGQVALSDLLDEHRAVVLVFYRGFF